MTTSTNWCSYRRSELQQPSLGVASATPSDLFYRAAHHRRHSTSDKVTISALATPTETRPPGACCGCFDAVLSSDVWQWLCWWWWAAVWCGYVLIVHVPPTYWRSPFTNSHTTLRILAVRRFLSCPTASNSIAVQNGTVSVFILLFWRFLLPESWCTEEANIACSIRLLRQFCCLSVSLWLHEVVTLVI